jgi:hypothetical protein
MTTTYPLIATRALASITKKGGTVTLTVWPPTGASTDTATGKAVKIDSDPDKLRDLGLIFANSITLLIAASGLAFAPQPGKHLMTWSDGVTYTIADVDDIKPNGITPILFTVVGKV